MTAKAIRLALIVAAGVAAYFAVSLVADWWTGRGEKKFQVEAATAATGTAIATTIAARADTSHQVIVTHYRSVVDPITGSRTAPPTPREREIIGACSEVITSCETRHVADVAVSDSLRKELKLWQNRPTSRDPRFRAYGEGLYDFLNGAPVVRVGATAKVLGRVTLSTAVDAVLGQARPPSDRSGGFRALAGVRVDF